METFLAAATGAFFALLGTIVQAVITGIQSNSNRRRELLIDAYGDYLNGLAKRASILHSHSERTEEATALMISGKQKISAFAPSGVVSSLAKLEETPMILSDPQTQKAMVDLVRSMRVSVGAGSRNLEGPIQSILFSNRIHYVDQESTK